MNDREILNVRAGTNADGVHIGPENRVEPDAALTSYRDVAYNLRARRKPHALINLGRTILVRKMNLQSLDFVLERRHKILVNWSRWLR